MPAILSRLSIFFINDILHALDNTKILCKAFWWNLIVKPTCANAALFATVAEIISGSQDSGLFWSLLRLIKYLLNHHYDVRWPEGGDSTEKSHGGT